MKSLSMKRTWKTLPSLYPTIGSNALKLKRLTGGIGPEPNLPISGQVRQLCPLLPLSLRIGCSKIKPGNSTLKKALILALPLLAACAERPENIAAADIGPNPYLAFSCSQLSSEGLRLQQQLENLSADQRRAAQGDAFGVFLLGLPVSSMSGNDNETDIAVTRGRLQAVEEARNARRCG